jgi:hypothetical protein
MDYTGSLFHGCGSGLIQSESGPTKIFLIRIHKGKFEDKFLFLKINIKVKNTCLYYFLPFSYKIVLKF